MEQQATKQHGAFSWNELMTTDVAASKTFYAEMFGWEMRDSPMPEGTYTMLTAGGRDVGGMMALPADAKGAPPAWGSYVTVDDVDQRVKRAEQLGGKVILAPQDIPNVGRFAVISDPQGAMLSLITYNENYQG
jgi:predicted enzyme related to lactoylglutathione lyase